LRLYKTIQKQFRLKNKKNIKKTARAIQIIRPAATALPSGTAGKSATAIAIALVSTYVDNLFS